MFYRPFDRSMDLWIINEFLKDPLTQYNQSLDDIIWIVFAKRLTARGYLRRFNKEAETFFARSGKCREIVNQFLIPP